MTDEECVKELRVPVDFKSPISGESPSGYMVQVVSWNAKAQRALKTLRNSRPGDSTSAVDLAASVAPLVGDESWIDSETRKLADGIVLLSAHPLPFSLSIFRLDVLSPLKPDSELVRAMLERHVKPLFLSSPHPALNLSSGRTLSRPAGGPMSTQDYYVEQTWKSHPGLGNLISWCIRQTPVRECYAIMWQGSLIEQFLTMTGWKLRIALAFVDPSRYDLP